MTELLFREDAYAKTATAKVLEVTEAGDLVLDRTLFYPMGGGQPGDQGSILCLAKSDTHIIDTRMSKQVSGQILHIVDGNTVLVAGDEVSMQLDWPVRYRRMRVHTALHLLSVMLPYPVTGGSIGECLSDDKIDGRLDFDIAAANLDKEALSQRLQEMVDVKAQVTQRWVTDAELDAQPELVKTMSVQPPRGSGKVRLIEVVGMDLQPCGGTHVNNIGEIGKVKIRKIENKGKINRRVRIQLEPA